MRLVARGLGFGNQVHTTSSCKVYKIGQKHHPAAASQVDEWTRAGTGGAVVVGLNPAQFMNFFYSNLKKFLSFLAG